MPTTTFENLSAEKRARVTAALLQEFSQHSLAEAQVARIVAAAGIARGAFYKYFADLTDAYRYLYQSLMTNIHTSSELDQPVLATAANYVTRARELVQAAGAYRDFFRLHYTVNEGLLPPQMPVAAQTQLSAQQWSVMVLVHAAIRDCFQAPNQQDQILQRLGVALTAILAGTAGDADKQTN